MLIKGSGGREEWIVRIADLIHASSDRAYLYRRMVLLNYNEDCMHRQEAACGVEFDQNPLKTARQALCRPSADHL